MNSLSKCLNESFLENHIDIDFVIMKLIYPQFYHLRND